MSTDRETQTSSGKKRVSVAPPTTSRGTITNAEDKAMGQPITEPNEIPRQEESSNPGPVFSCQFEVFGIVQGVSFRMYTLRRAQKLGVRGWCQNTTTNSVKGEIEGYYKPFEEMRLWLKYTGSPTSRIDKVVFSDTSEQLQFTFENFSILMD